MNKETIEKIIKILPVTLKNISGYIKDNFEKSGQDALSNVTGSVGILIKLFAQDKLDSYFENISKNKLKDFGSNIYLKASLVQVNKSLEYINEENDIGNDPKSIEALLNEILTIQNNQFNKDDILTIFTPKYHPIIIFTKDKFISVLNELNISNTIVKKFISDFNENIEITVKECFGEDDYRRHKDEIKGFILKENETNLLWDTYQSHKIGFKEDENLEYEKTYASWKPISKISNLSDDEERDNYENFMEKENNLVLAETLVNDYFDATCPSNCLNNILFAVADFGKGKTIFLQQYAVKLAKEYLETKEGYFPIYFNLRDIGLYSSDATLGIIGDYLLNKYSIRIDDDYFKIKKYIFLIDSLDESGDLTKSATEKVIQSIKNIQNIDKEFRKNNRIVITSRPFPDGLEFHLKSHNPFEIENAERNKIPQYLSIYGFKANQFNHWLYSSLKSCTNLNEIQTSGFAKEIINSILKDKEEIDIHKKLIDENTLSKTELRRPIFAYMIFQLILNNVDFLEIGKIGVYLSFINLLTRKAKHINDTSHKVNLTEEIKYRNILHSISSLWMYERQHSQQGILKKADICRVIEPKYSDETDKVILEKFKENGIIEIQFMSHSYFGENNDVLHFQHQSFAEILLAEYYLKVFIKFALDEDSNIDDARAKLILGEPTEQTIVFFKELIKLLKETVSHKNDKTTIEKRKLLYPLMASLSLKEHNTLHSRDLYYDWFRNVEIDNDSSVYPEKLLINWAITEEKLEKIINFASKIIDDKTTVLMSKTKQKSALFNNELTVFQNKFMSDFPTDLDKWLSLTLGNILENNIDEEKFFNSRIINTTNLFQMIKNWNYSSSTSAPEWVKKYFIGIMMKDTDEVNLRNLDLSELNFSYSNLININMSKTNLSKTCFNNCIFKKIEMESSTLYGTSFDNIRINGNRLAIGLSQISQNILIPIKMANLFLNINTESEGFYVNNGLNISYVSFTDMGSFGNVTELFNTLKGLLSFGLKKELFKLHDIKTWFKYEDTKVQNEFESLIDTLK